MLERKRPHLLGKADFVAALEQPKYELQSNARADYIEIAKQPERAEAFIKALSFIESTTVFCGISAIIDMEIYKGVSSLLNLRDVIPPYALAARMCIEQLHQWESKFAASEPVEFIFEEGDFEQGKFTELMVDEGQTLPIYKKKRDFAGLQAADHYAWEQAFFLKNQKLGTGHKTRLELGYLLHHVPKIHVHAPQEMLIKLCHARGIDPRTGIRK